MPCKHLPKGSAQHWVGILKTSPEFHEAAKFFREASDCADLETTLQQAVRVFFEFGIPHFVCGGFAVQERGYPRYTMDIDIIVPDVELAYEKLCRNGFKVNPGSAATVMDQGRDV